MDICVGLFSLMTLLNSVWLSSSAIDGVLAELVILMPGVQLMSSKRAFCQFCKIAAKYTCGTV